MLIYFPSFTLPPCPFLTTIRRVFTFTWVLVLRNVLAFIKLIKESISRVRIFPTFLTIFLESTKLYGPFFIRFLSLRLSFLLSFTEHVARQRLWIWNREFLTLRIMAPQRFTFPNQLQLVLVALQFPAHSMCLQLSWRLSLHILSDFRAKDIEADRLFIWPSCRLLMALMNLLKAQGLTCLWDTLTWRGIFMARIFNAQKCITFFASVRNWSLSFT